MKTAVRPSSFAQAEIRDAIRHYESAVPGLGEHLWNEIQSLIALIAEYPEIGEQLGRSRLGVRRFPLRRFPFVVIYRRVGITLKSLRWRIRAEGRDTAKKSGKKKAS